MIEKTQPSPASSLTIPWAAVRSGSRDRSFGGAAVMSSPHHFDDEVIAEIWVTAASVDGEGTEFVGPAEYSPAVVLTGDLLPPEARGADGLPDPRFVRAVNRWVADEWPGTVHVVDGGRHTVHVGYTAVIPFPATPAELLVRARSTVLVDVHRDLSGANGVERQTALWGRLLRTDRS